MKNSIILSVRIDYSHTDEAPQHELTAANLVIRNSFPSIEEGVQIENVEAYLDGEQLIKMGSE